MGDFSARSRVVGSTRSSTEVLLSMSYVVAAFCRYVPYHTPRNASVRIRAQGLWSLILYRRPTAQNRRFCLFCRATQPSKAPCGCDKASKSSSRARLLVGDAEAAICEGRAALFACDYRLYAQESTVLRRNKGFWAFIM